ncbi:MAG TPA: DUF4255 domain-containing protein [Ginsengibacter sp.]|nr:DUF4255 domain-containing protein [Ginsengibacter sp.]
MLFPAIDIIRQELNNALVADHIHVELGNISEILSDPNTNRDETAIIISLINIEENRVSRDPNNYIRKGDGILMKNPAVHLYLSLLFTAIRQTSNHFNDQALQDLQQVIGFFQKKFVFDHSNTPNLDVNIEKLILDMVSLNLQQMHEIWTVLGGKYFPSVVYRMRMVTIDYVSEIKGPLIEEIETDYFKIEQP